MEEFAINLNPAAVALERLTTRERVAAYLELTKPRITFLIVLTSAAGFAMASGARIDYTGLLRSMLGIALLSSGIATINQYMERDLDALMRRTANRPLPSGKLLPNEALMFGASLIVLAELYLAVLVNPLTALIGLTVIAGYLFAYTPLKTRTSLSTMVGAVPGALPPLIGWAAARGSIGLEAWVLFAIVFVWQMPHVLAVSWLYREDYARGGIRVLPVEDPNGRSTAFQMVNYAAALVPVSLMPTVVGIAGRAYLAGAIVLSIALLAMTIRFARNRTPEGARRLFAASLVYLPVLWVLMLADRVGYGGQSPWPS